MVADDVCWQCGRHELQCECCEPSDDENLAAIQSKLDRLHAEFEERKCHLESGLLERIDEALDTYQECYENGMSHEDGYDFASDFHDLLVDVLEFLRRS